MREIGHFIGGKTVKGDLRPLRRRLRPQYRRGAGQGGARQQSRGRAGHRQCRGGAAGLGGHQSAAPRARDVQVSRAGRRRNTTTSPNCCPPSTARCLPTRKRRHPARPRGGGIRLRHSASDEGRIHRRRRPRHRPLFDAPAARRGRRHHAVQFPGDDPAVEMRAGDRLRQCLHPQAIGARPIRADADRRTVSRGRPAARHPQRRQRRQGSGRYAAHRSAREGDRLRRLLGDRANTSMRPAARTANACSASAAPRTT